MISLLQFKYQPSLVVLHNHAFCANATYNSNNRPYHSHCKNNLMLRGMLASNCL